MQLKILLTIFALTVLFFTNGVFAQSEVSGDNGSLLESSNSGQIPPQDNDKKLLSKVERYSNQVLENYRKNLTALDKIYSSTQKYYLEKVKPEEQSEKADGLMTEIQNKRDKSHQDLSKLKKRVDTIKKNKKVDKNNKSALKNEGEDSIRSFDEYKSKVTEFVEEVKNLSEGE